LSLLMRGPGERRALSKARLDATCQAPADFTGIKYSLFLTFLLLFRCQWLVRAWGLHVSGWLAPKLQFSRDQQAQREENPQFSEQPGKISCTTTGPAARS
jgi:hypothetical protein